MQNQIILQENSEKMLENDKKTLKNSKKTKKKYEYPKKESNKALRAFHIYRDLGYSRTLHKVSQKIGKSDALVRKWSQTYNWVERVRQYEIEVAEAGKEKAREEYLKRVEYLNTKALKRLEQLKIDELNPREAITLATKTFELKSKAMGINQDNLNIKADVKSETKVNVLNLINFLNEELDKKKKTK